MDVLQPEPQEASAPEAAMHDAAAPDPGLSPLVVSRQSSQAPAEPPQPGQQEEPVDGANGTHGPAEPPQPGQQEQASEGANGTQSPAEPPPPGQQEEPFKQANGTHNPASARSGSSHSTPGPQPLPLPLPPPSSAPAPAPAPASAPPPPPGLVPRPSASSPRPGPVPTPLSTGNSPVAGPNHGHHGHHGHHDQQPPPAQPVLDHHSPLPRPALHYQQPSPPAHHGRQPPPLLVDRGYQPSPVQQGKVAIVEPPNAGHRDSSPNANGLRSPTRDHAGANPKFSEDVSRLTHAIQQSLPEAVRHVTREHWKKTLLGSDYHQSFVMSAGFLHSNAIAFQRAVGDNGRKMVTLAKRELIQHFAPADLDVVADAILAKASDKFLDKALEMRLATINARSLINALARNGRLGYESSEVDGNTASAPAPVPAQSGPHLQTTYQSAHHSQLDYPPPPAHATHAPTRAQTDTVSYPSQPPGPALRPLQPLPPGGVSTPPLQCHLCWRKFQAESAFEFHTKKRVCTKPPPDANGFPFNCPFCGAGFVTAVGKNYHHMNKVCGDHGMAPATPGARNSPIALSSGTNSPVHQTPLSAPPKAAPPPSRAASAANKSQPVYQTSPCRSSPGPASTPLSSQKFSSDDPYSHLKPAVRKKLEEELRQAELAYRSRFEEAAEIADENERLKKQEGLQNSFSTKQSIIRKKYGVRLRQRRTKAEIDAERERVTGTTAIFSRKRPRADSDTPSGPLPKAMDATPASYLSVVGMNSTGLGGSVATAATADPTAEQTPSRSAMPRNSLASYQRNGYRVNTHVPVASRPPSSHLQDVPMADTSTEVESRTQSPDPKRGTPADPIVLDASSSNSESDADEDIPATLPPGRAQSISNVRSLVS